MEGCDLVVFSIIITLLLIGIASLCFLFSYQVKRGKWLSLVASYNDLTPIQKAKVNTDKVCRDASRAAFWGGIYMVVLSISLIILLNDYLSDLPALRLGMISVPTIVFIAYISYLVFQNNKLYKKL